MRGLKGKVAIVAGAAPGNIGGATAVRLAQEGAKVIAADLDEAAAQTVVDEIKSARGYAVAKGFDITNEASYQELIGFAVQEFGGLDGLFNVAARSLGARLRKGQRCHVSAPRCLATHD